jgi:chaperonin GroES
MPKVTKPTSARPLAKQPSGDSRVTPLSDRVLLRPLRPEELGRASASGIIIPETADKEKPEQGEVIAVGPGKRDESGSIVPMQVKIGDRVVFSKYGYDEIAVEGTEYYILSESNILAIIK